MAKKRSKPKKQAASPDPDGLTARQRAFVNAYLAGPAGVRGNGKQAAIAAGYASHGASVRASELLTNRKVAAVLSEAIRSATEKCSLTLQTMVEYYARVAFSPVCPVDFLSESVGEEGRPIYVLRPRSEWTPEMEFMLLRARSKPSGEVEIELRDRVEAERQLAKYVTAGGFSERVMLAGDKDHPLVPIGQPQRDPDFCDWTREELKVTRERLVQQRKQQMEGTRN